MLIDTHCHLTDERFNSINDTVRRASDAGVGRMILPSTSLVDAKKAAELAKTYKLHALAGIHPEEVEQIDNLEENIKEIKAILNLDQVIGIGEIGLDFYWDKEKKTEVKQIDLFRKLMELAVDTGYPVAIHMRNAEKEMAMELKSMKRVPRGQFHCFSGSSEFLEMVLGLGFYVSFCGNITYKSAGNLRELLKLTPLERLLLETDSPYLPPEPLRGTLNEPANVKIVGEFIASELNLNFDELAVITTNNTKCLYSLEN